MKRILSACLLFLLIAPYSFGQFSKGTGYLGATVSFNGSHGWAKSDGSSENDRGNMFSANPLFQFGTFVADNKMIGLGISANLNGASYNYPASFDNLHYSTWSNTYSLMPYFRQYKTLSPKWAIFIQPAAKISLLTYSVNSDNADDKQTGFGAGLQISPGVTYRVSSRFALESDINLLSFGVNYTDFRDNNVFRATAGISTSLSSFLSLRAAWYLQKQQ